MHSANSQLVLGGGQNHKENWSQLITQSLMCIQSQTECLISCTLLMHPFYANFPLYFGSVLSSLKQCLCKVKFQDIHNIFIVLKKLELKSELPSRDMTSD